MNQNDNPYSPPSSEVRDVGPAAEFVRAARWRRFGTFVVDYLGLLVLRIICGIVLAIGFGPGATAYMRGGFRNYAVAVVLHFLYYTLFEGLWARTPGKWVLGTVVVDEAGGKPSLKQVLIRTVCRYIPFEPLSALSADSPPWHDSIAKTRVVQRKKP